MKILAELKANIRKFNWFCVLLMALSLSVFIVVMAAANRREGNRTATEAHIPLRAPTADEVGAILNWSKKAYETKTLGPISLSAYLQTGE